MNHLNSTTFKSIFTNSVNDKLFIDKKISETSNGNSSYVTMENAQMLISVDANTEKRGAKSSLGNIFPFLKQTPCFTDAVVFQYVEGKDHDILYVLHIELKSKNVKSSNIHHKMKFSICLANMIISCIRSKINLNFYTEHRCIVFSERVHKYTTKKEKVKYEEHYSLDHYIELSSCRSYNVKAFL